MAALAGAPSTGTIWETTFQVEKGSSSGPYPVPITTTANPNTVISLPPLSMLAKYNEISGFWNEQSFSQQFVVPPLPHNSASSPMAEVASSLLLTFEAMSAGDIIIALSPISNFCLGKTYACIIGGASNKNTCFIRRRLAADSREPPKEVQCRAPDIDPNEYQKYWLCIREGTISFGLDSTGPENDPRTSASFKCLNPLLTLHDGAYDFLRTGMDRVRYVGLGNLAPLAKGGPAAASPKGARDRGGSAGGGTLKVRNITLRHLKGDDVVDFGAGAPTLERGPSSYKADEDEDNDEDD